MVTYDDTNLNRELLHSYINSLLRGGLITDWWHYIGTSYIVASTLGVNALYNAIFPGIPKRYLLIIEVDPNNTQGWVPPDAWTWIQKYQKK